MLYPYEKHLTHGAMFYNIKSIAKKRSKQYAKREEINMELTMLDFFVLSVSFVLGCAAGRITDEDGKIVVTI
jgi:hypothetical protein